MHTVNTYHGDNLAQTVAFYSAENAIDHAEKCAAHATALSIPFRVEIHHDGHWTLWADPTYRAARLIG